MSFSYTFELFSQDKILIQPFKKIEGDSLKTIQDQFKAQGCTAIVLNSELILSLKHILIAMNKALSRKYSGAGKDKEVIQLLQAALLPEKVPKGPNFNFMQTNLSKAGILVVHMPADKDVKIGDYVKGEEDSLENIGTGANFALIKELYAVDNVELGLDTDMRGSVYTQIALKQLK